MLSFAPFYWLYSTLFFSFFLRNCDSLDEIFGIPLRGLCDWASGFNIHDCIWKCQQSIFWKIWHGWPCLTFLQNRVLKKIRCLLWWGWSFLHCRCIRSPSGLHGLFLDMFFQRPNWWISRLKPKMTLSWNRTRPWLSWISLILDKDLNQHGLDMKETD